MLNSTCPSKMEIIKKLVIFVAEFVFKYTKEKKSSETCHHVNIFVKTRLQGHKDY